MNNNKIKTLEFKVVTLSKKEEHELILRYQNGDTNAITPLLEAHNRYIYSICRRYMNNHNLQDLFSEGVLGMIKAVTKFDISKDVKFLSYASSYIYKNIRKYAEKEVITSNEYKSEEHDDIGLCYNNDSLVTEEQDALDELLSMLEEILTPKEVYILEARHGLRGAEIVSLKDIGKNLQLSKEGVRKSQRKAEGKLLEYMESSDQYDVYSMFIKG